MKKFNWLKLTLRNEWAWELDFWWCHSWVSTVRAFIYNVFNDPYGKERKHLPRYTWEDRDSVMENVVFELFIQYCDSEDKNWRVKFTTDDCCPEEAEYHNKRVDSLVEIYDYIKSERPRLIRKSDNGSIKEDDELDKADTKYLIKIIEIRGGLWT